MIVAGLGSPAQAGETRSGQDEGSIGIQLQDAPVSGRGDPRALRYIVDHLAPGAVIERNVLVVNRTDRVRTIEVYPAAASVADGQFLFGADRAANDLTSWIATDRTTVEVGPGGDAVVAVTVRVPADASPGERYAVLWAATASDPGTGSVAQVNRVGVRVYLDVGPGGPPATAFTTGRFTAARGQDGVPTVTVPVTNSGGRAVDLTGSAALSDGPAGLTAGPFPIDRTVTLAAGQSSEVVIRFPAELPNGPWLVEVTLASGTVQAVASERMSFPEPGQIAVASADEPRSWLVLGAAVGIGLLLVLLLGLAIRRLRSGPRPRAAASPAG